MDLGLTHADEKNKQYPAGKNNNNNNNKTGLILILLENTPQLFTLIGYKYNTTLPTHLILNFSIILCTKHQPL